MAGKSFDALDVAALNGSPVYVNNQPPPAIATVANQTVSQQYTAGSVYYGALWLPQGRRFTKAGVLNAATVGTDKLILAVYNRAGQVIGSTAIAGVLSAGANAFQEIALIAALDLEGPDLYYLSVSGNVGTDTFLKGVANGARGGSQVGVFGTLDAISSLPVATAAAPFLYLI